MDFETEYTPPIIKRTSGEYGKLGCQKIGTGNALSIFRVMMLTLQVGKRRLREGRRMPEATQHNGDLSGKKVRPHTLTALLARGKMRARTQSLGFGRATLWASYHGCEGLDGY